MLLLDKEVKNTDELNNTIKISKEEKAMLKKLEKKFVNTYFQKLTLPEDHSERILEMYNEHEEVRSIISEMKMKLRDLEYLNRKKWTILKKFNLQQKVHQEESKSLNESERVIIIFYMIKNFNVNTFILFKYFYFF